MALQYLALILLPFVIAIAWLAGGRSERAATAAILTAWSLGLALTDLRLGRVSIGLAISDAGLLVALGRLALGHDRWWLLAAAAAQGLAVAAHLAMLLRNDLSPAAHVSALVVFDILLLLALLVGVMERWLAGEAPASKGLRSVPT